MEGRSNLGIYLLIAAVFAATGCATSGKSKIPPSARVHQLEFELKKKQQQVESLKERNLVLEQRAKGTPPIEVSDQTAAPGRIQDEDAISLSSQPQRPRQVAVSEPRPAGAATSLPKMVRRASENAAPAPESKPDSKAARQNSEQILYAKVIETYRNHKFADLQKALGLLQKNYPDSVYADSALYVAGLSALQDGDLLHAEDYMNRVIMEFPRGKKVVAALYAKAAIEKRKGRINEARGIFSSLKTQFPGSPEAARARLEVKLIDQSPTQAHGEG